MHAGASERESEATGAVSGSAIGGIDAPTALDSSAQAKHFPHVDLPGVESCLWPVTCARSCSATACWPMTTATAIHNAKKMRRTLRGQTTYWGTDHMDARIILTNRPGASSSLSPNKWSVP